MYLYEISNGTDKETHLIKKENFTEVRHWIINTLDLSKNWLVQELKKLN